jgi:hypothetical protein
VYQYIIKDTVDERIATRSARNGHPLLCVNRSSASQYSADVSEAWQTPHWKNKRTKMTRRSTRTLR